MKKLKSKLAAISANKILDVGTGVGNFISNLELLKDYKKIVGIDNSREMLERAKNNFDKENIEFVLMDAENLNYEDNTFDMVSLSNSLHHLAEIDIVLNEMKRVLKSEGILNK